MTTEHVLGPAQLWTQDTGGGGIPVVLLHPGIADAEIWSPLLPHLAGRRVVRFDRPGFGRTPIATAPYRGLDTLMAVLDGLDIDRAHLVGNSMGGGISLAAAVTHPERVASLTLMAPGIEGYPFPDPKPEELAMYERWGAAQEAGDFDTLTEIGLGEWCRQGSDEYLSTQMLASFRADAEQASMEQDDPEQWEACASLDVPTSVLACQQDPWESLLASKDLAGRIPGAQLFELDLDHVPQYRDPEAVARVVLATLARGDGFPG